MLNSRLPQSTDVKSIAGFNVGLFDRAEQIQQTMMHHRKIAQDKQKLQYDKNVSYQTDRYKVGDLVKIINYTVRTDHCKAWEPKFLGPFKVVRVFTISGDDITYEISDGKQTRVLHYNRFERFFSRGEEVILGKFPIYNVEPVNNAISALPDQTLDEISHLIGISFEKSLNKKNQGRKGDRLVETEATQASVANNNPEELNNLIEEASGIPIPTDESDQEAQNDNLQGSEVGNNDTIVNPGVRSSDESEDENYLTVNETAVLTDPPENIAGSRMTLRSATATDFVPTSPLQNVRKKAMTMCIGCGITFKGIKQHQRFCDLFKNLNVHIVDTDNGVNNNLD